MNNYMVKETMSDIQWVASTGYAQIRTQTDYPAFLYYVLNTSKYNKAVMVRCTGSSYPAINSEDLSKIPFYKCGITEQNGENGAFPPTRNGCIHSLSMRESTYFL